MSKRVLIVDDDGIIREAISMFLTGEGYDVIEAENGADALSLLSSESPCVILLDLMMPVMSGPEFLAHARADARLAGIPVVVFTAMTDIQDLTGHQKLLHKPVPMPTVLRVVSEFCGAA